MITGSRCIKYVNTEKSARMLSLQGDRGPRMIAKEKECFSRDRAQCGATRAREEEGLWWGLGPVGFTHDHRKKCVKYANTERPSRMLSLSGTRSREITRVGVLLAGMRMEPRAARACDEAGLWRLLGRTYHISSNLEHKYILIPQ